MNQYFTEVSIPDPGWRIDYRHKIMLMGSCFVENIGNKLEEFKFQVDLNPFGILYNPQSISKSLQRLLNLQYYKKEDLFEHQGIWSSFDHHSKFSSIDSSKTLKTINEQLGESHKNLKEAEYLIITFGTSWVYELKRTGEIVSNCHKIPEAEFKRFRLTPGEIVSEFKELLLDIWKFNSNLKILFTVSPIRHWKDGAVENQRSKSTLLLAVDRLVNGFGEEKCAYFPSYEIVMDELRDYRFYAPDMLHLNEVAVEHIWQKFSKIMLSNESIKLMKDVLKLNKAAKHRPFNSGSESYRKFLLYNLDEIGRLTKFFPFLNFNNEQLYFESKLSDSQAEARETLK
ncbi:GSCFA domain-containing protein [Sunxiuqinia sp. A32]|uniref:GSCFA domain-containing protein n=1 Tax=Sunxiuqinia sp. A32 TaxID=3461496 RepID=UPI00404645C8